MAQKKRKPSGNQLPDSNIQKDILEGIRKAFPDGLVEIAFDPDESYFFEVYPELEEKLSQIKGTNVLYEREWNPDPVWYHDSDPDEDLPDWIEDVSSYHLFFLGLTGQKFQFETEDETPSEDDEDELEKVAGTGTVGCSVGVSLIAPFALVTFNTYESFENGSQTIPDVQASIFTDAGAPIDTAFYYRERWGDEVFQALCALRNEILEILGSCGISLLPEEEANKPVPWLKPGEAFLGENITVRDAFFFQCP